MTSFLRSNFECNKNDILYRNNVSICALKYSDVNKTYTIVLNNYHPQDKDDVVKFARGEWYSGFLLNNGKFHLSPNFTNQSDKTRAPSIDNIIDFYLPYKMDNYVNCLLLTIEGKVYGSGSNVYGQLGKTNIGETVSSNEPILIKSLKNIIRIWCSHQTSLFLDNEGTLFLLGVMDDRRFGIPMKVYHEPFILSKNLSVKDVIILHKTIEILLLDGSLYHNKNIKNIDEIYQILDSSASIILYTKSSEYYLYYVDICQKMLLNVIQ